MASVPNGLDPLAFAANTSQPVIPPQQIDATPPPNIDTSQQQQQQVPMPQSQEAAAPPKKFKGDANLPAIVELAKGLIKPPSDQAVQTNNGLYRPANRMDVFENFLGNFLQSFATGMSQSGHGPGANLRGAGAAIMAGPNLAMQRQQFAAEQAQRQAETERAQAGTNLTTEQARQMGSMVTLPNGATMPLALAQKVYPALVSGQAKVAAAGTQKRYMSTPFGMFDTQSGTYQGGASGPSAVQLTPDILQAYDLPNELLGKTVTPQGLASLMGASARGTATVTGAAGPALVQKTGPNRGQAQSLGLGSPAMGGIAPVADPNNPGNLTWQSKGSAIGKPAPGSAATQGAVAVTKSAIAGDIGKQVTAFNTALQHADLLSGALDAMGNGTFRPGNALYNRVKTEFGDASVTNFQTIAQAYSDEVQAMLSKGHITEGEQKAVQAKLPANASPAQIRGAIASYKALAQSKMNILQQQVQQGQQGKVNFPQPTTSSVDSLVNKYK